MTDQGNDGDVPPAAPAAPPPLAATPPPAQPAYQPAPAVYALPPARSGPGLWPLFTFLAFAIGVGGTILTLWLMGDLWKSRSSFNSGPGHSGESSNGMSGMSMPSTPAPIPAPPTPAPPTTATTGYPPTPDTLTGTWGPGCPGSSNDVIIFYDDGTAASDGETGTWQIDGNNVTLNNGSETLVLQWEMLADGRARVRRSGSTQSRVISRCS